MYLADIAKKIKSKIPSGDMPEDDSDDLMLAYAVLARAKGVDVTCSDVHDAWSAWMVRKNGGHPSLVPFEELSKDVRDQDAPFVEAIKQVAVECNLNSRKFADILFPVGVPKTESESKEALELYKIMVASSEGLVARRQGVNTFFLTINGALLTASGLLVQGASDEHLGALGIAVLCAAGLILCGAWRSLIISFGQLNGGKFKVINSIERYLRVAIYAAEWEALGRGEDPKIYRSFTSREIWVPSALFGLHLLGLIVALCVFAGFITFKA